MRDGILCIFLVAALGMCFCDSVEQEENICDIEPPKDRGHAYILGWFYDDSRGECRTHYFGDSYFEDTDPRENKFRNASLCWKKCRPKVPTLCFEEPRRVNSNSRSYDYAYNSTVGHCILNTGGQRRNGRNGFQDEDTCNRTCRDKDLGECALSTDRDCNEEKRYRYDDNKQRCEQVKWGECGLFSSMKKCEERCGRFATKKCDFTLLTSVNCDVETPRYWYNRSSDQCVGVNGCNDDTTNFHSPEECWKSCASTSNRCLMKPLIGKFPNWGSQTWYYFNITKNSCETTRKFPWNVRYNSNLFRTSEECEKLCKPMHRVPRI